MPRGKKGKKGKAGARKGPPAPRLWVPPAKKKKAGAGPRGSVPRLARFDTPEAGARRRKVVVWDPAWTPRATALEAGPNCVTCRYEPENAHLHGSTLWTAGRELF